MATAHVEERELLQAMTWYDGFVVALANPSFLLTSLGLSVLSLGGWGAIIVWSISVMIGGLHNNIYAEVAAMFPKLSGGVAVYAHEAWKRYTTFFGPIAAVGYWLGWSVVLALNSVIVAIACGGPPLGGSSGPRVTPTEPGLTATGGFVVRNGSVGGGGRGCGAVRPESVDSARPPDVVFPGR